MRRAAGSPTPSSTASSLTDTCSLIMTHVVSRWPVWDKNRHASKASTRKTASASPWRSRIVLPALVKRGDRRRATCRRLSSHEPNVDHEQDHDRGQQAHHRMISTHHRHPSISARSALLVVIAGLLVGLHSVLGCARRVGRSTNGSASGRNPCGPISRSPLGTRGGFSGSYATAGGARLGLPNVVVANGSLPMAVIASAMASRSSGSACASPMADTAGARTAPGGSAAAGAAAAADWPFDRRRLAARSRHARPQ
jgi:hypothetical protein